MVTDKLITEILKRLKKRLAQTPRPVSVYRLQFNSSFTFRNATKLVPYLQELGITHCYTSPYFKARPGSQHGYDIINHNELNPEIGTVEEYDEFVHELKRHGMGQILDFVPNHVGIFDNPKFLDILENGPSSINANFFDIDWLPIKTELHQKVLLPILEDLYGRVLEDGHISLAFEYGTYKIKYHTLELPVDPRTMVMLLEPCLGKLEQVLGKENPDYLELQSITTVCQKLPPRTDTWPESVAERQREKEIIKRRLSELCAKNEEVKASIAETTKTFNRVVGDDSSFARLHDLLEAQAYRLSYWRVASEEINYRRFFDINELVALRMEDPQIFEEVHILVRRLLLDGKVQGIRLDHVDGLFGPEEYLWRLQKRHWLDLCLKEAEEIRPLSGADRSSLEQRLSEEFDRLQEKNRDSRFIRPLFLVVEKILGEKERLPETWPIEGTTGYDFMNSLNQLFVNRNHRRATLDTYRWFTGNNLTFPETAYQCKDLAMRASMSAEVNLLAHQLSRISEKSWQYRDFTLNSLRDAIREIIACFPVYRTYIDAERALINDRDQAVLDIAISEARRRNPIMSPAIFDFVKNTLLLQCPPGMTEDGRRKQRRFVMRFQQFTSPVMAKGVEDTAFYVYNPLVSLNEVGGSPQRFGASAEEFHRQNLRRREAMPFSFMATSTHDTKRGEDVRARINVLSEIPREWRAALARWRQYNRKNKGMVDGDAVPDRNEEYLLYQTLIGTYPMTEMDKEELVAYRERIQKYMMKAVREAKVHSSWISPNIAYEDAVLVFVAAVLKPAVSQEFLTELAEFSTTIATWGMYRALSQVVLKIFSPGVPDIYQGNELWALNLTDPDNRRPVDFEKRVRLLNDLKKQIESGKNLPELARELLSTGYDGKVKLYVTWRSLNYRRDNVTLFSEGSYVPLKVVGAQKTHLCAFAWKKEKQELIVAVPRLVAGLTLNATVAPLDTEIWSNTHLILPQKLRGEGYQNIFSSETVSVRKENSSSALLLAEVFKTFPVAVLESVTV